MSTHVTMINVWFDFLDLILFDWSSYLFLPIFTTEGLKGKLIQSCWCLDGPIGMPSIVIVSCGGLGRNHGCFVFLFGHWKIDAPEKEVMSFFEIWLFFFEWKSLGISTFGNVVLVEGGHVGDHSFKAFFLLNHLLQPLKNVRFLRFLLQSYDPHR